VNLFHPIVRWGAAAVIALLAGLCAPADAATTLLPPGEQCFQNANGPLSSGSINMFFVGTSNPKPTYQDSNQQTLNTQPIQLDANGCATIFGVGAYRQQLYDGPVVGGVTTGNLIFDKITTDTSAYNAVFWAGTAGGTPNAITVVDTGFNGTDGSVVNFVAISTNTSSTTINPSGFGDISVVKSTTAGPVSLVGGEIQQGNTISVVYSASANSFTLLNPPIQSASGATAPLCGATNLKITNNGVTPNLIINLTADQIVMQSPSGLTINRSNVSLTAINISTGTVTSTANGMDGESPGTSQWLNVWAIDNGAAPAGLVSVTATAPTMPSGYSYKCRMGAMRVDGSGNLLRTLQGGNDAQYTITTTSNTLNFPIISTGTTLGSPTVPTWSSLSVSNFVPPTARRIKLSITVVDGNGTGNFEAACAPNGNNTSGLGSSTTPAPLYLSGGGAGTSTVKQGGGVMGDFVLESTNIFCAYATSTATNIIALGWRDGVNAN
jgi:hypothetical protein